ncbi:pleckstrin homology domain-containing family G member 4B isoform X4 [Entelurus aequoreus]|uniref:pleckstrin homology domain-containing family G member 4B isoform X4 n=1 Tax=Entelurus aequoreus TaxID=161455 RepID=UPI002B1E2FE6|nr:pleckstrin homology domain-containing family G member 4B isoform X4 [Entelurus aequoreus]
MLSLSKMHSRAKSRSCDNYLSIKDAESLDNCIQSTLSALYHPFSATASTVLWQLFSVVERQYRGDGLRCFIDFLLPAKRILQIIQQETCIRFRGLLLYHEGWPLCIHDKVVLQLCPLHKVRLKQGDFYLQVVPLGRKTAKLVIKCLSSSGQAIVEISVAESMYGSVFTTEFLQNVTLERNLHPLQNCLLTTGTSVYRTPWKNVVNPPFVSNTAEVVMQAHCTRGGFRGQLSACSTSGSTGTLDSHRSSRESLQSQGADLTFSEPVSPNISHTDASSNSHSTSRVDITTPVIQLSPSEDCGTEHRRENFGGRERGQASKMLSFSTDLSNPSPRRRHPRDSVVFESRRLFRKSYMEALQNPMSLGSSSESILEENTEHSDLKGRSVTLGSSPEACTSSHEHLARRLGSRGWLSGDDSWSSTPLHYLQRGLRSAERRAERRSKSLERTNKADQIKAHRERSSSGGSASISPKKLMNGYVLRFGKLEVETALPGSERRSGKEGSGQQDDSSDSRRSRLVEEESHCPKTAKGSAIKVVLSSSSSSNDSDLSLPKRVTEVNQDLLASGAVILPGSRDRSGRAVLQVCTRAQVWAGESCTVHDLTCLMAYYHSTLRKEKRDEGLTVVIDSRRQQPVPALLSFLSEFQTLVPNALYLVLFLVDKEAAGKPERDIVNVQTETLSSLKALLKHIEQNQLTPDLEGTFSYDHNHWILFRQKIEPFASSCSEAISSLQESIATLSDRGNLKTCEEVSQMMEQQKHLMKCVLDDTHLNRLRLEGGTILARIRKEEACDNDSYRDAVDILNALYNQLDEEVHELVILSNKSQKDLESLLEVRRFEEQTQQVNQWMEHCQDYISHLNTSGKALSPAVVQTLQHYCTEASKFSMDNFSTLNDTVLSLDSPPQVQQWNMVWHKCQQTKHQLEDAVVRATSSGAVASDLTDAVKPTETQSSAPEESGRVRLTEGSTCSSRAATPLTVEDSKPLSKSLSGSISSSSSRFTFPPDSTLNASMFDDTDSDCTIDSTVSCHSEPISSRVRKPPMKKIMKKTMSYELTQRDGGHSDVSHVHGYTGVYIKGLEVANNVSAEKKLQRPDVMSPTLVRSRSMSTPSRIHNRHIEGDGTIQSSKVQHIMDEMISTEREYVRSLSYVIEHYFPEMERLDLPQDLRGKRSIIFGNMEKLGDFHTQYFLKELEACAHSPLSISSCFLRHEDQFGMYALYSKNKPRSDTLLSSHGNEFFKNKQLDLGDKMDLASYLLKPIQRMSKYALLLKDLIKECSQSQTQELSDLRTAEEMVKFQLRHGNDLLAMDAIQGCDVNLKEQGQLRCQDEFIVWCGRRKYLRHVFLFEDLILFSKTKKIEGGYDIYIYKQSYKTAEIGMTENVGDSGLRFEIWFRRRKSQDTFILQAGSVEAKAVWTSIIGKILWRQALRNRELRMQEMVSMGIGSKPFMDIKPSDAAINDRAIDYIMKGSECRTRASIAVPSYEYSASIKRPHSTISNSSTSSSSSQSSSSLLGSLNLHLYSSPSHPHAHLYPLVAVPSFAQWPYDCIEEDELEQDSSSQPSMITESSETSSQCTSNDSLTGLSTLTLPGPPDMDSFNNNEDESPSFLCSSTPPSTMESSSIFPKSEELQQQGNKFITASKTSHIAVGLSTVV